MHSDTPEEIGEVVISLCSGVVPGKNPVYVSCEPESYSIRDECYSNVERKVSEDGGEIAYGWQIWLWPDVLIEAEFHAIWESPEKELLDITPKENETPRILFLSDPGRKYEGSDIDNVRVPLSDSKVVFDFIALAKARFAMLSRGRIVGSNSTSLNPQEYEYLAGVIAPNGHVLANNLSRNSPCLCGSGSKYKHCHEREVDKIKRHYKVAS